MLVSISVSTSYGLYLQLTFHIPYYITGTASAQYWIGTVGNAVLNYCDMSGTYSLFSLQIRFLNTFTFRGWNVPWRRWILICCVLPVMRCDQDLLWQIDRRLLLCKYNVYQRDWKSLLPAFNEHSNDYTEWNFTSFSGTVVHSYQHILYHHHIRAVLHNHAPASILRHVCQPSNHIHAWLKLRQHKSTVMPLAEHLLPYPNDECVLAVCKWVEYTGLL